MPRKHVNLTDRFLLPPFSVLDTRQDYWQKRKAAWLTLGIKSELGRGADLTAGGSGNGGPHFENGLGATIDPKTGAGNFGENYKAPHEKSHGFMESQQRHSAFAERTEEPKKPRGRKKADAKTFHSGGPGSLTGEYKDKDSPENTLHPYDEYGTKKNAAALAEKEGLSGGLMFQGQTAAFDYYRVLEGTRGDSQVSGTSIFDPVLCEAMYRWYSPEGGSILDPFAGGSVRGVVAAYLHRQYTGVDLSAPQIAANKIQWEEIKTYFDDDPRPDPKWHNGDSTMLAKAANAEAYDAIFSCPPYCDLERYSDDPRDISTMAYPDFIKSYGVILAACARLLKPNRFFALVISAVRDTKTGLYYNFYSDTISILKDAGLDLYNDAVLINVVGSLPIRVGVQFDATRKLGRGHQNVLVFVKGDPVEAAKACGGGVSSKMPHAADLRTKIEDSNAL